MKSMLMTFLMLISPALFAQAVEVKDQPVNPPATGKQKAQQYMQGRKAETPAIPATRAPDADGVTPRYLALHIGSFFTDHGYKWGKGNQKNIGDLNAGLTYRVGEWVNSMDLAIRVEYTSYDLDEGAARKLSFEWLISFPDANSRFPLYFGGGVGPGFFVKQINKESVLGLDYSLFGGVRLLNVIERVGFMLETGIKNHLHLFSDGQFNGLFINVGCVFAF